MAVSNTKLLDLLGKQVSFSWLRHDGVTCHSDGQLMSVVFLLITYLKLLSMIIILLLLIRFWLLRFWIVILLLIYPLLEL